MTELSVLVVITFISKTIPKLGQCFLLINYVYEMYDICILRYTYGIDVCLMCVHTNTGR